MRLAEPAWLALLILVPVPWLASRLRGRIAWPSLGGFRQPRGPRGLARLRHLPPALRALAIAAMAVAMARPQTVIGRTRVAGEGVAIVVAIDHSSSMNTVDAPSGGADVTRLEAAKATLARFVAGRLDDLVGLVAFANYPVLRCPPTLDHEFLLEAVRGLRTARPGDDGTNIGDAVAWSLAALEGSASKRRVVILLTDGRNSPAVPHPLDPVEAAGLARDLGVTLHTIAVGRTADAGGGKSAEGPDLELLGRLARIGGGRAFVAADPEALARVFATIDALEKSPVRGEVRTRYREGYGRWVALALGLLVLDRLLSAGRLRRLP